MRSDKTNLIPEDFDLRFQRAFGLLAFSVNRHIVDHMRRLCIELSLDPETAQIWGSLAHLNVLPNLPLGADPMVLLNEMGRKKEQALEPIRLAELSQITGLPRETVRRKLENLRKLGKVERTADGRWIYCATGVGPEVEEFTRNTVLKFLGGLLGGPVARFLLSRLPAQTIRQVGGSDPTQFEQPTAVRLITAPAMIETLALISVCLLGGQAIARALAGSWLELPSFVCVLFVGVLLRNGLSLLGWYAVFERAVSVMGNVSLALFLALALMSLRLWELASLALPMFGILLGQAILMATYAIFVTFPAMGRNYDAAVIAAGHCGFGLGATPTAIANMQAVTDRFGMSQMGFLIVPIVGAFFIDLANALVIKLFLLLPIT